MKKRLISTANKRKILKMAKVSAEDAINFIWQEMKFDVNTFDESLFAKQIATIINRYSTSLTEVDVNCIYIEEATGNKYCVEINKIN